MLKSKSSLPPALQLNLGHDHPVLELVGVQEIPLVTHLFTVRIVKYLLMKSTNICFSSTHFWTEKV